MLRTFTFSLSSVTLALFSVTALAAGGFYATVTPFTEAMPVTYSGYGYNNANGTALSADGSTIMVSAAYENFGAVSRAGRVYFYRANGGSWPSPVEVDDPDGTADDNFGVASAISGDGSVALIGSNAPVSGQAGAGKAYIYTRSGSIWTKTHEFDDPAATANDAFGISVALSADGKVAVVGAIGTNGNHGEIYIYTQSGGTWSAPVAFADPDSGLTDVFGVHVAVSSDGTSAFVSSSATTSTNVYTTSGKVYLYTLNGGTWSQSHEFDDPAVPLGDDSFGVGLASSSDGSIVLIGAFGTKNNTGEVYTYTRSGSNWTKTAAITDPDNGTADSFGGGVALSADGTIALIRSDAAVNGQARAGKVYLYANNNGTWVKTNEFDDPAAGYQDDFGFGVTLSGDAHTAFITAPRTTVAGQTVAGEGYAYQTYVTLGLATSSGTVDTGEHVVFTSTLTNEDTSFAASDLSVSFSLPAGLSAVSESADGGSCNISGATVTCTLASLAPGASWQPAVTVNPASSGSFAVSTTASSGTSASNDAVDTASITVNPGSGGGGGTGGGGGDLGFLTLFLLSGLLAFDRRRDSRLHRAT